MNQWRAVYTQPSACDCDWGPPPTTILEFFSCPQKVQCTVVEEWIWQPLKNIYCDLVPLVGAIREVEKKRVYDFSVDFMEQ
jgi:hypothetical protein